MNERINHSVRQLYNIVDQKIEQEINKRRNIDSLLTERNQQAATQVRNIGGSIDADIYAYFGVNAGGKRVSP